MTKLLHVFSTNTINPFHFEVQTQFQVSKQFLSNDQEHKLLGGYADLGNCE